MKKPSKCVCGGKAEVQHHKRFAYIMCTQCERASMYFNARTLIFRHNGAIKAWESMIAKEKKKVEEWLI